MKDIFENAQLQSRDFWTTLDHSELGASITYPGTYAKFNKGKCAIRQPAPLLGEHNKIIYQDELGFTKEQLQTFKFKRII